MAHRAAWLCSDCGYQLGEIVDGALRLWVQSPMIGPEAMSVECPRCHVVNVWRYCVETAAS